MNYKFICCHNTQWLHIISAPQTHHTIRYVLITGPSVLPNLKMVLCPYLDSYILYKNKIIIVLFQIPNTSSEKSLHGVAHDTESIASKY